MPEDILPHQRIKMSWIVGTVAVFSIFVLIGAYSSRMTWDYSDFDHQRSQDRYITLKKVQDAENALLTGTAWVDQSKNIVRIPIDEAMAKEVDTLRAQTPHAGVDINPPAAPAPPSPAPAAPAKPSGKTPSPAPGAAPSAGKPTPTNK